jgi:periplasmic protein TonB
VKICIFLDKIECMQHLATFVFMLISISLAAQDPVAYYRENGENASGIEEAAYYRTIQKENDRELHTYYWLPNRVKKEEGYYKNNKRTGLFKTYYKSGAPQAEIVYGGTRTRYAQFWSPEGKPLLEHSTGVVPEAAMPPGWDASYMVIEDSLLACAALVRPEKGDTLCYGYDINPQYPGGHQAMSQKLRRALVYPKHAREVGVEGKVTLEFIVNKTGRVEEMAVAQGIGFGCDEVALAALNTLEPFKPATYKGKPVKVSMRLPLMFHLESDEEPESKKGRKKKRH